MEYHCTKLFLIQLIQDYSVHLCPFIRKTKTNMLSFQLVLSKGLGITETYFQLLWQWWNFRFSHSPKCSFTHNFSFKLSELNNTLLCNAHYSENNRQMILWLLTWFWMDLSSLMSATGNSESFSWKTESLKHVKKNIPSCPQCILSLDWYHFQPHPNPPPAYRPISLVTENPFRLEAPEVAPSGLR